MKHMTDYRRTKIEGGTYFFTVNCLKRHDNNLLTENIELLRQVFRQIPAGEKLSQSRKDRGERGIWQRRYWEHLIRDDLDYRRHVDYIHWNPVKHGWVSQVKDWPHSSFLQMVRRGVLSEDWACEPDGMMTGEI